MTIEQEMNRFPITRKAWRGVNACSLSFSLDVNPWYIRTYDEEPAAAAT